MWLYFRFTLSFRDVEELLAERGIEVSYETIRCWTIKFGPQIAKNLKARRLRKAHRMTGRERGIPMVQAAPESPYDRRILRLAFLAPELQRDILGGLHPPGLNLERLMKTEVPLAWAEQRVVLGWAHADRP